MKFSVLLLFVSVNCESLQIFLYRRGKVSGVAVESIEYLFNNTDFKPTDPTVLYIHGHSETQSSKSVKAIVSAYCERDKENFLSLDWSCYSDGAYTDAVKNVEIVALYIASKLFEVFKSGFGASTFHIVGHSLGAQLAGSIGRNLQSISKNRIIIPRITGLDPANPLYTSFPTWLTEQSLQSSDARFVDIIHTDIGFYGTSQILGHANFFVNGGRRYQPGCPNTLFGDNSYCSHRRSWVYWAESVAGKKKFIGKKSDNYLSFVIGLFVKNDLKDTATMGMDCDDR